MKYRILRLSAITCASLLACAAGCQFPDFHAGRGAARTTPSDDVERLTARQVADVQLSLGHSLQQRGDVEQALTAYRKAVEKDPQRSAGYWRMAVLNDRQGNVQESEALYRQALKADPKNPEIRCDYGYSLYLQRRWAEAEENLRQAVAVKSSHHRAHNNLGLVLAQTDRLEEALSEFRKAGCQEADARANLAFVMTLNRRWDEAREQYELALDANPGSAAAKTGLDNLDVVVAKTSPDAGPVALASYERSAWSSPGPKGRTTQFAERPVRPMTNDEIPNDERSSKSE